MTSIIPNKAHAEASHSDLRRNLMLMTNILHFFAAILPLSVMVYISVVKSLHGPLPQDSNLLTVLEFSLFGSMLICMISILPLAGAFIIGRMHKNGD